MNVGYCDTMTAPAAPRALYTRPYQPVATPAVMPARRRGLTPEQMQWAKLQELARSRGGDLGYMDTMVSAPPLRRRRALTPEQIQWMKLQEIARQAGGSLDGLSAVEAAALVAGTMPTEEEVGGLQRFDLPGQWESLQGKGNEMFDGGIGCYTIGGNADGLGSWFSHILHRVAPVLSTIAPIASLIPGVGSIVGAAAGIVGALGTQQSPAQTVGQVARIVTGGAMGPMPALPPPPGIVGPLPNVSVPISASTPRPSPSPAPVAPLNRTLPVNPNTPRAGGAMANWYATNQQITQTMRADGTIVNTASYVAQPSYGPPAPGTNANLIPNMGPARPAPGGGPPPQSVGPPPVYFDDQSQLWTTGEGDPVPLPGNPTGPGGGRGNRSAGGAPGGNSGLVLAGLALGALLLMGRR